MPAGLVEAFSQGFNHGSQCSHSSPPSSLPFLPATAPPRRTMGHQGTPAPRTSAFALHRQPASPRCQEHDQVPAGGKLSLCHKSGTCVAETVRAAVVEQGRPRAKASPGHGALHRRHCLVQDFLPCFPPAQQAVWLALHHPHGVPAGGGAVRVPDGEGGPGRPRRGVQRPRRHAGLVPIHSGQR